MGPRPYIRPLASTRDEHDLFVLALLSLDRSRFYICQIGQAEEVFQVKGEQAVAKPEAIRNEARVLANVTELVLADIDGRHLVLSAAPELHPEFVSTAISPILPTACSGTTMNSAPPLRPHGIMRACLIQS
jgi:hypothetical protein